MKTKQNRARAKSTKKNDGSARLNARERKLLADLREMILAARQTLAGQPAIFAKRKKS